MPNQKLLEYIDQCLKGGISDEQIKESLLRAGWSYESINAGFDYINKNQNNFQISNQPNNNLPKQTHNSFKKIIWIFIILILTSGVSFAAYKFVYVPVKQKQIQQQEVISDNSSQNNANYNSNNLVNCIQSSSSFSFNMRRGDVKTEDIARVTTKINYLRNDICNLNINYSLSSSGESLSDDFTCNLSLEDRKKLSTFFDSLIDYTYDPQKPDILRSLTDQGLCSLDSVTNSPKLNTSTVNNTVPTTKSSKTPSSSSVPHITSLPDVNTLSSSTITISNRTIPANIKIEDHGSMISDDAGALNNSINLGIFDFTGYDSITNLTFKLIGSAGIKALSGKSTQDNSVPRIFIIDESSGKPYYSNNITDPNNISFPADFTFSVQGSRVLRIYGYLKSGFSGKTIGISLNGYQLSNSNFKIKGVAGNARSIIKSDSQMKACPNGSYVADYLPCL